MPKKLQPQFDKIEAIKKTKPTVYKMCQLALTKSANIVEIGKIVNRDKSSVYRTLRNYGIDPKKQHAYKKFESEILYGKQEMLINGITKEKVDDSKIKDIAITYGILKEKQLLVDGKATQNIAFAGIVEKMDREERQRQKPEFQDLTSNNSAQEQQDSV